MWMMRNWRKLVILAVMFSLLGTSLVWSHCQVPCGIYNDRLRVDLMAEHLRTIEKAMKQVQLLKEAEDVNANQIVRWIQNKEKHAEELSDIITFYFMAQRIKPTSEGSSKAYTRYVKELTLLHRLLVTTMKAKQGTDPAVIKTARTYLSDFSKSYLGEDVHGHGHSH